MTEPTVVKTLLPEHRDRVWRRSDVYGSVWTTGSVWSWDEGRQQWLDESLGEANQRAWADNPSGPFIEYKSNH